MSARSTQAETTIQSDALLQRVVELCQGRKAENIKVLDVRELVEYMDYMVIATGRSGRQNRAIAEHVLTELKRGHRVMPLSKAGMDAASWICLDFVDVVLHIFDPDSRDHYDLELLWGDAESVAVPTPATSEADDA